MTTKSAAERKNLDRLEQLNLRFLVLGFSWIAVPLEVIFSWNLALLHKSSVGIHLANPAGWQEGMNSWTPTKCKTTNWSIYSQALRQRVSLSISIGWIAAPQPPNPRKWDAPMLRRLLVRQTLQICPRARVFGNRSGTGPCRTAAVLIATLERRTRVKRENTKPDQPKKMGCTNAAPEPASIKWTLVNRICH